MVHSPRVHQGRGRGHRGHTWTLVSIDTRTPSTRPTLVSIDTPPTLLRHYSDTLRHSKPAIQTVEMRASCLSSVNSVKLRHSDMSDTVDTPDTPTLDTPTHYMSRVSARCRLSDRKRNNDGGRTRSEGEITTNISEQTLLIYSEER